MRNEVESYYAYKDRFDTFAGVPSRPGPGKKRSKKLVKWPHQKPTPDAMAAAGFFFNPVAGLQDNATCFMCHKSLDGWEVDDDPATEHIAHAPECSWARIVARPWEDELQRNGTLTGTEYDPLGDEALSDRIQTFAHWPHSGRKGWRPTDLSMARAGFFYNAHFGDDDIAQCAYCEIELDGWEPEDDPVVEHRRRKPDCVVFSSTEAQAGTKRQNGRHVSTNAKKAKVSAELFDDDSKEELFSDPGSEPAKATNKNAEDETQSAAAKTNAAKAAKSRGKKGQKAKDELQDKPKPDRGRKKAPEREPQPESESESQPEPEPEPESPPESVSEPESDFQPEPGPQAVKDMSEPAEADVEMEPEPTDKALASSVRIMEAEDMQGVEEGQDHDLEVENRSESGEGEDSDSESEVEPPEAEATETAPPMHVSEPEPEEPKEEQQLEEEPVQEAGQKPDPTSQAEPELPKPRTRGRKKKVSDHEHTEESALAKPRTRARAKATDQTTAPSAEKQSAEREVSTVIQDTPRQLRSQTQAERSGTPAKNSTKPEATTESTSLPDVGDTTEDSLLLKKPRTRQRKGADASASVSSVRSTNADTKSEVPRSSGEDADADMWYDIDDSSAAPEILPKSVRKSTSDPRTHPQPVLEPVLEQDPEPASKPESFASAETTYMDVEETLQPEGNGAAVNESDHESTVEPLTHKDIDAAETDLANAERQAQEELRRAKDLLSSPSESRRDTSILHALPGTFVQSTPAREPEPSEVSNASFVDADESFSHDDKPDALSEHGSDAACESKAEAEVEAEAEAEVEVELVQTKSATHHTAKRSSIAIYRDEDHDHDHDRDHDFDLDLDRNQLRESNQSSATQRSSGNWHRISGSTAASSVETPRASLVPTDFDKENASTPASYKATTHWQHADLDSVFAALADIGEITGHAYDQIPDQHKGLTVVEWIDMVARNAEEAVQQRGAEIVRRVSEEFERAIAALEALPVRE